jgi:nucleoside-diphosphate-sugar epimerase
MEVGRINSDMNILVTGSAGFVAKSLIPKLKNLGHNVIGIDKIKENLSNTHITFNLKMQFDGHLPKIGLCIHLASEVGGIIFNVDNEELNFTNKLIDNNVIKICKKTFCDNMIF